MKTALQTLGILLAMVLLLVPLIILGKDEKPATTERKAELRGNKLVELVRPRGGTNHVWRERRSFPLMFSRPAPSRKRSAP